MKVSVVIPVYNEEKYIEKCLLSLKNQVEKPDEIIVVDNNCTDKTIDIARKFNVLIIRESRQGITYARNCGFNHAKGTIIARCDADVILPPDWIKKIKENFKKNNIDALTGPLVFYDLILPTPLYAEIFFWFMKLIQKGKETLIGPNMILSKKIWDKVKNDVCLDNNKVHEDIDLTIHINKIGGIIKRDNGLIVNASGRRIKHNPLSFFVEYPIRWLIMLRNHY